jgi:hypothetical protein
MVLPSASQPGSSSTYCRRQCLNLMFILVVNFGKGYCEKHWSNLKDSNNNCKFRALNSSWKNKMDSLL